MMKVLQACVTWALVVLTMGTCAWASEVVLPDTPIGRLARHWFDAFGGDDAAMRSFIEREGGAGRGSLDERVARTRPMRSLHGTLTPVRLLDSGPRRLVVLARDAHGGWLKVAVEASPDDPPTLTGIGLQLATGDEQPAGTDPLTEQAVVESVTTRIDRLAGAGRFSGVVRLERAGRVLVEQARGEADRVAGAPVSLETRFNLGSINKLLTKLVILKLEEQGKLAISDRLVRHLPDFPQDKAEKITVEQLLEMSSGLGDVFGSRYDAMDRTRLRNPRDWFPLFIDDSLAFEPGTGRRYSNAGYMVLGALAERLTGRSYYDLVREWIYVPAGMTRSDSYPRDGRTPNLAIGYTRGTHEHAGHDRMGDDAPLRPNTDWLPWRGSPAGGGYSTAADLSRLFKALVEGRILRPATVARYFGGSREPGGPARIALGVAGGSPGCNAAVEIEGDWTLIVLTNLDPPAASDVAEATRAWIERVAP